MISVLEQIMLEEANKKIWYACISAKTWGSLFGSAATAGGIPWGHINRVTSAVASPGLKESVIRWIKHNNFIKHVHIDGNTITVDEDWWDKEKNTEVIILEAPEGSTFKGIFSDRNIGNPYTQHGGIISGGGILTKSFKQDFAKRTGIKSSTMTIESAIKKAGLKIKTGDTGIDVTGPINAWKKFNGWESSEEYFDSIDLFNNISDDNFDLMKEYNVYTEGVKKWIKKAEKKSGVTLEPSLKKGISAVAKHYKNKTIGFEALGGDTEDKDEFKDNKKKFNKNLSKAYIKSQVYKLSDNKEYQEKAKQQASKYDDLQHEYQKAKELNSEKIQRREGQLKGTIPNPNNLSNKIIKQKLHRHNEKDKEANKQKEKEIKLLRKIS